MIQKLPVDGVRLVVEDAKQFLADLNKVNAVWDKTANRFRDAGGKFAKAGSGMTALGAAGKAAGIGISALGAAAAVAVAAIAAVGVALIGVGVAAGVVITKAAMVAGSFQEMEFTALAVGRAMGLTEAEIRGASQAIQEEGIRADVANKVVAQFARNQLDLAKATDLVKIAQATGIIVGEDSSATMESLTRAITTGSTVMLRRMGIMVDNAQIEKQLAADLGVHTDELTNQQVMQARTNAIIEASTGILGVYDAAMESPTKQLRSWTGRLLPSLQAALGAPFLGAFSSVIKAVSDLTKALTAAMQEGGALYPLMIKLGAIAGVMADAFASAINWITDAVTGLSGDISVGIGETLTNAVQWGIDLIAAFATGITEATPTILVGAMNGISNMLTSWLAPGSPPKVAKGIVGWGVDLMDMYLRGMTEADFGILEDIQGPLKKLLSGPAFADVSKTLAEALAGGDRAGFLETVGKAGGPLGDALKQLAVANFDLADSVTAVQTAEDALATSREKLLSSQAGINKATVEYNRLLRAGASDAELQTQLGLINAAEDNMRATVGQVGAQEDALDAAKQRQEELEAEEKLQQNIVDQLLQVNDALKKQEKEKAKARVGVKGPKVKGVPPAMEAVIPTGFSITSRIGDAVEAMKQQLKDKFADMFKPITDAWDNMVKKVSGLGTVWDEFKVTVGEAWGVLKEKFPILQDVEDWVTNLPANLKILGTSLKEDFLNAMTAVGDYIDDVLKPLWDSFADFSMAAWELALAHITKLWNESVLPALKDVWAYLDQNVIPIFVTLGDILTDLWENVISKLADGFKSVTGALKNLTDWFNKWTVKLRDMKEKVDPITGQSPSPVEEGLMGINKQLQVLATTRMPALANMGSQMAGAMAPTQMLSPQSNTSIVNNMGGNTFNNGTSEAAFNARVEQAMKRQLRR